MGLRLSFRTSLLHPLPWGACPACVAVIGDGCYGLTLNSLQSYLLSVEWPSRACIFFHFSLIILFPRPLSRLSAVLFRHALAGLTHQMKFPSYNLARCPSFRPILICGLVVFQLWRIFHDRAPIYHHRYCYVDDVPYLVGGAPYRHRNVS